jgi:hypothetical protein
MSQRLLVLFACFSLASSAFAQNAPAAKPAAKAPAAVPAAGTGDEVPAPPPATTPTPATPAPATPAPAPTSAAPAPATPAPGPAPVTPAPQPQPAPAGTNTVPPPPTFPQGAEPTSPPPAQVTGYNPEPLPPPPEKAEPLGMFGLSLSFGFAFGGEKLVAATFTNGSDAAIHAGQGATIGLGVTFMPIRAQGHSLGISVNQSAKFASISASNADITLTRFPLVPALRYNYAFNDTWNFLAAGGLVFEYGISLTGSGDAEGLDQKFKSALGFMAEAGVSYRERSFLVDVTLRYTGLTYETDEVKDIDAKSGALVVAGHYFF